MKNFMAILTAARKGEQIVYHTGLLTRDRAETPAVGTTAYAAWDAYQRGICLLVQRRLAPFVFEYIAVRR